ncbi:MAG: Multidrug resistance operon repressor [Pseudomonadota bacterium]|jgi:DNA-binding MarR family transcriptional regulator
MRRPRSKLPPFVAEASPPAPAVAVAAPSDPTTTRTEGVLDPVTRVDTSYLETLIGYNARRSALTIISLFLERMAVYGLRPVDFSVLSVIAHNPGVTSRMLCASLGLLPPNLVSMIQQFEQRELIDKKPHPHDGRALALYLTPKGQALMEQAEATAFALEREATAALTEAQRNTLRRLLKRIYAPPPDKSRPHRGKPPSIDEL